MFDQFVVAAVSVFVSCNKSFGELVPPPEPETTSNPPGVVVPIPTLPAFRYSVFATALVFTEVNAATAFCVIVKSAPGAILVIIGLVIVGPEENTTFVLAVPAVPAAPFR